MEAKREQSRNGQQPQAQKEPFDTVKKGFGATKVLRWHAGRVAGYTKRVLTGAPAKRFTETAQNELADEHLTKAGWFGCVCDKAKQCSYAANPQLESFTRSSARAGKRNTPTTHRTRNTRYSVRSSGVSSALRPKLRFKHGFV